MGDKATDPRKLKPVYGDTSTQSDRVESLGQLFTLECFEQLPLFVLAISC